MTFLIIIIIITFTVTFKSSFKSPLRRVVTASLKSYCAMGSVQSKPAIDGLGLVPSNLPFFEGFTPESKRKLEQLIRANNHTFGFLFNNRKFHNHAPHHLVSAFFLGASPEQLVAIYEDQSEALTPWKDEIPIEVIDDDWKKLLGQKKYERGFFNYFSDKVGDAKDDWCAVVQKYCEEENLLRGLTGGLVHPLIHLGYAVEANSAEIAIEALAMACTEYLDTTALLPKIEVVKQTTDPVEIITEIRNDTSLDNKLSEPFEHNVAKFCKLFGPQIAKYGYQLKFEDPKTTMQRLLYASTNLLVATHQDEGEPGFDFFLLHALTSSHAVTEIILSPDHKVIPDDKVEFLLRELWVSFVVLYIAQLRPLVKPQRITSVSIGSVEQAWQETIHLALTGAKRFDSHYVKAIRAMLFAELFTQDDTGFYARAALFFARHHKTYAGRTIDGSTPILDITPNH